MSARLLGAAVPARRPVRRHAPAPARTPRAVPAGDPACAIALRALLDSFPECVTCVCEAVNGGEAADYRPGAAAGG